MWTAVVASEPDAKACGGCFHQPEPPTQSGTVVTDHRMIFSISLQQSTLYDEIKYAGSPSSFAWVLPIRGQVTVGLSSDTVFASLEQATAPDIVAPPLPSCPACTIVGDFAGAAGSSSGAVGGGSSAGVNVLSMQTIGPYETVQLQSTDPTALDTWLAANGYVIPPDVQPIIAQYVTENFDFLALKLAPGQGVQAMRPVRVTSEGAGLSLPLRMIAAGTGARVGLTLWIIADGRYEPANFPFFTISPAELTWDWSVSHSNYTTVQVQKEAASNNAAWQIESAVALSPYVIENGLSGGGDYVALPGADGGTDQTAGAQQTADLGALFPEGNVAVRVTRVRADLAHLALANDLLLQASADQSILSNVYQVTKAVNAPQCPTLACSGSSSGSMNAPAGSSGSVGPNGDDGGGSPNLPSRRGSSGCTAAASAPAGDEVGLLSASFLGMALLRGRRRCG
jgi:hypothetical protein